MPNFGTGSTYYPRDEAGGYEGGAGGDSLKKIYEALQGAMQTTGETGPSGIFQGLAGAVPGIIRVERGLMPHVQGGLSKLHPIVSDYLLRTPEEVYVGYHGSPVIQKALQEQFPGYVVTPHTNAYAFGQVNKTAKAAVTKSFAQPLASLKVPSETMAEELAHTGQWLRNAFDIPPGVQHEWPTTQAEKLRYVNYPHGKTRRTEIGADAMARYKDAPIQDQPAFMKWLTETFPRQFGPRTLEEIPRPGHIAPGPELKNQPDWIEQMRKAGGWKK